MIDFIGGQGEYAKESPVNPTLRAGGQGAVAYGISSYQSNAMKSSNPLSGCYEAMTSRTLDQNGGNPACHQGGIAIVQNHAIGLRQEHVSPTLIAQMSSAVGTTQDNLIVSERTEADSYAVRRLTPTECARLQGFPDRWGDIDQKSQLTEEEYRFWTEVRNTHAAINGRTVRDYTEEQMLAWYNRLQSDSAEYKMWGNGIALPTALYCMQGMAEALNEEAVKCQKHELTT